MEDENEIIKLNIDELKFDPKNPRFARFFDTEEQPEDEVIERMVAAENIQELMGSIAEQGYFVGEPLLVAKSECGYVVVEGNRRLAALKLLSGKLETRRNLSSIEDIKREANHIPTDIPCQVFEDRKEILRYLGYRHITGAKRWDSLSKAKYINQLREYFYQGADIDEMTRSIAKEIGSRKDYVAQMLTGLTVYENAVRNEFYGLQHVRETDIEFSLLTTAISYSNIARYLGLESRTDINAEGLNEERSKDIFLWLYSQNPESGSTVLGESRNLRKLADITANSDAIAVLKRTSDLDLAYLNTEGPAEVFIELLNSSYANLSEAYSVLSNFEKIPEEQIKVIQRIVDRAEDIEAIMKKRIKKKKREEGDV